MRTKLHIRPKPNCLNRKVPLNKKVYRRNYHTKYKTYNSANAKIELNENNSEFSAYVNYQYNADRFILEPGLRLQKYTLGTSPEPRLGIKYLASDVLRLKLATGLYSQNIISTVSDRDVVNLFYGFISSPENLPTDEDGNEYKNQIQKQ